MGMTDAGAMRFWLGGLFTVQPGMEPFANNASPDIAHLIPA